MEFMLRTPDAAPGPVPKALVVFCTALSLGPLAASAQSNAAVPAIPTPLQATPGEGLVAPGTPQAWALATTAMLSRVNGRRDDSLGGEPPTPKALEVWRRTLVKWWDVHDAEELRQTLDWLQYHGHREEFEQIGRALSTRTPEQRAALVARADPERQQLIALVEANYTSLGSKGIVAWDYVRYIAVCRWAYLAGYLSSEDAWARIMKAALVLQASFGSWQEMADNYMIGRQFWTGRPESDSDMLGAIQKLLTEADSPWKLNSWNMKLSPDAKD
jgi:hypothetical protein